ncbi:MAG: tyrosine-type recombinase/integrase [Terriglobales bacterium]
MAIFKRGGVYWFDFRFNGERIQRSTKQGNRNVARDIAAAYRTALAKGEVGIEERSPVPTLTAFKQRFLDEIRIRRADHPETIQFYECKYSGLLKYAPLAQARLDRIDEQMISAFTAKLASAEYERSTINRHLATLKRALRLARKWKLIKGVPAIEMLSGENQREFVLSRDQQRDYIDVCPEFLRNWAQFALETGMRRKELHSLQWADVHFDPVGDARRGYVHVRGTKSRNSKRNLSLTMTARMVLERQQQISKCGNVFVSENDHAKPSSVSAINHAHERVRNLLEMPSEFVPHSFRHSFGTRLGEAGADAFTIMRIMGHSSITVSQRYVHPTSATMENAIMGLERATEAAEQKQKEKADKNLDVTTVFTTVSPAARDRIQ